MTAVCFYFQVHQPYRLRSFSLFEERDLDYYFHVEQNCKILRKVAERSYLPANAMIANLLSSDPRIKFSFSISGVALEQMQQYCPAALDSFKELAASNQIEFLAETYHHSLAAVFNAEEFKQQVALHEQALRKFLGLHKKPSVFRNTELIYSDSLGEQIAALGYVAVLAEGPDDILAGQQPTNSFVHPACDLRILVKHYRLSDDIAFRFCDSNWSEYPLTPQKFARWVRSQGDGVVNIFIDYETFGEHQWSETGIWEFLEELPGELLREGCALVTPSEAVMLSKVRRVLSYSRVTSWADYARDLSAWNGNDLQKSALRAVYDWSEDLRDSTNSSILETWRRLQTSDHFYYMSTKDADDGQVHAYFSPYESPYIAFVNYMNCLRDFKSLVDQQQ